MSREVFLCGLIVWSLFQFLPFRAASQIQIDTTHSANALVNNVLKGNGVLVGNVKYTGARHAIAYFEDEAAETGISKGIMLTTGNALMLAGPNRSTFTSWVNGTGGDRQLESIARGKTYDASVLEFDFITAAENLSFYFVFASEEYLEYVDSRYNDVFAFFITGP
ncbi:MAG TPA: choice-of-anchor L domain-containing protein, partial [Cyclobacteriaceae bacterium]|nr:choice-of-anchor L domain-containing protein [Cyclobacteriaceae bacterium]